MSYWRRLFDKASQREVQKVSVSWLCMLLRSASMLAG